MPSCVTLYFAIIASLFVSSLRIAKYTAEFTPDVENVSKFFVAALLIEVENPVSMYEFVLVCPFVASACENMFMFPDVVSVVLSPNGHLYQLTLLILDEPVPLTLTFPLEISAVTAI